VWPSDEVVEAIAALPRPRVSGVRWTTPPQWHVTLRFYGQVGDGEVDALSHALAGVAARHRRFDATVGPEVARFGRGILQVPVAGLDALAGDTVRSTATFGEPPEPRPFAGHLTLARARRGGDVRPLTGAAISCSWTVDELTLVRSTTSRDGAIYDVLARFPLA
jgi:RNA 2',3'-cyclic 3'-phosphodiesterase